MYMQLVILGAALVLPAGTALAEGGDAKAGAVVFKKCMSCHVAVEAKNRVGPTLMAVVGRPVASIADYKYSTAMTEFATGGKMWDEATLTTYLAAPKALVKGTKMAFAGLKKPEDVANVIAYLKDPKAAE